MKQYLYTSIICFIIAIIGILLISCAMVQKPEPRIWQSNCASNTILAIITVGQEYPTRGRCSKIDGTWHIQAEYKKGDIWIPLQIIDWPQVKEGKIEFEGEETRLYYMTGQETLLEYCWRLKE